MPIYSFFCNNCKTQFELLVNVTSDGGKPKCEKCGSNNIARTFSGFAVGSPVDGSGCKNDSCSMTHNFPGCCPGCKK